MVSVGFFMVIFVLVKSGNSVNCKSVYCLLCEVLQDAP